MKYLSFLIGVWLALLPANSSAQSVQNIRIQSKGNLVMIYYDLIGEIPGQLFEIKVFSSHNSMESPLLYVRGDVGTPIAPGTNKYIEWGVKKEMDTFNGVVSLKLEATLIFSPIVTKLPNHEAKLRRGRSYEVTWNGGVAQENLQLELWKDSTFRFIITRVPNTNTYTWELPLKLTPGENYTIRLVSVQTPTNFRFTEPFAVRRKIAIASKLAPVGLAAGIGIWVLIKSFTPTTEPELPAPNGPPK